MAARDSGVAVVAGTFEPAPGGRVYNTVVAYDAAGELAASYRKIHLYDALGQRESELVAAGHEPVIFDLDGVLIDSEQVWDDVREGLAHERGGRWHAGAQRAMMGMSSLEW